MDSGRLYKDNLRAYKEGFRLIANKGGTRSGKTYSICSVLLAIALYSSTAKAIDVVSESIPHLKRGALNDMKEIVGKEGITEGITYIFNETDKTYSFANGSKIRFFSADDFGKVKGSRRDVLFINECNRIDYETYRQLAVRTALCIFLDWNPDSEFWYEVKGLSVRETTKEIHSTYKDNPYLGAEQIAEIESNKDDVEWWKVYGLGLTGKPQGLVFNRWERCNEIPEGAKLVARGLDFGFTNDPTAIVDVFMNDGKLWLDETCYQRGLTNDRIAEVLKGKPGDTVADSAEMKSITEIANFGIKIEPSQKGADSVMLGIDIMNRYEMRVTSRSLNLIYELRNYKWDKNAITGELLNKPIDRFNHCIDAVRYVVLNKLAERPRRNRPRGRTIEY